MLHRIQPVLYHIHLNQSYSLLSHVHTHFDSNKNLSLFGLLQHVAYSASNEVISLSGEINFNIRYDNSCVTTVIYVTNLHIPNPLSMDLIKKTVSL